MNFALLTEQLALDNNWSALDAIVTPETIWSHHDVHELGKRAASILYAANVREKDCVFIALDDSIYWIAAFLGVARIGATSLIVNPHLNITDYQKITTEFNPALCLVNDGIKDNFQFQSVVTESQFRYQICNAEGSSEYDVSEPTAPLYAQFTSGSTGDQKCVPHRHEDMFHYRDSVALPMLNLQRSDVLFSVSKLFFAYGLGNSLAFPLTTGCSALLLRARPDAEAVIELVDRYNVTVLFWVPTGYALLTAIKDKSLPCKSLRLLISAGEVLQPALAKEIGVAWRVRLLNQLGSTEAGHAYCGTRCNDAFDESVGLPLPGFDITIRDEQGSVLDNGAEGEVWVRGPTIPTCYLNNEQATKKAYVDGWLRTGDKAKILSNGHLKILGRVDDMEMIGGIKMSPLKIEALIRTDPAVVDVAVTSALIQNATKLVAYVVGHPNTDALHRSIKVKGKHTLPPYMIPAKVADVAALPRTTTGKLQRHILRSKQWQNQHLGKGYLEYGQV